MTFEAQHIYSGRFAWLDFKDLCRQLDAFTAGVRLICRTEFSADNAIQCIVDCMQAIESSALKAEFDKAVIALIEKHSINGRFIIDTVAKDPEPYPLESVQAIAQSFEQL